MYVLLRSVIYYMKHFLKDELSKKKADFYEYFLTFGYEVASLGKHLPSFRRHSFPLKHQESIAL